MSCSIVLAVLWVVAALGVVAFLSRMFRRAREERERLQIQEEKISMLFRRSKEMDQP